MRLYGAIKKRARAQGTNLCFVVHIFLLSPLYESANGEHPSYPIFSPSSLFVPCCSILSPLYLANMKFMRTFTAFSLSALALATPEVQGQRQLEGVCNLGTIST